jgi:hypothetical protein
MVRRWASRACVQRGRTVVAEGQIRTTLGIIIGTAGMKHRHVRRLTRATCAAMVIAFSLATSARTSHVAVALVPTLVSLRVDHSSLTPRNAALGEDVRLDAYAVTLTGGPLPAGQRLVILGGKRLVKECPITRSRCSDIVSEDGPTDVTYRAEIVLRGQKVGTPSGEITVIWKFFPLRLNLSVQAEGTAAKVNDDPLSYTLLAGIPFKVNYSFPDGLSSSASAIKIERLPEQKVVQECKLNPEENTRAVKCSTPWLVLTDLTVDTTYQAVVKEGFEKQAVEFRTATVVPVSWELEMEAAGKNGASTTGVLNAAAGEDVQLTALITEKNAARLTPYVEKLEVVLNDGTVVKTCPHARTCPAKVSGSGEAHVDYKGEVLVKDATGGLADVGEASAHVKWSPGETIAVKPGRTTADMVTPKTSLNGTHTLSISGAISDTFTDADGKQRTLCEDYLYAETVDGVVNCSGSWPEPDGKNTFRVDDDTSLVLVLNTCQAWPCGLDNQLSPPSPRSDFNTQHKYTTTVVDGDIIGTTAFWATPLGFSHQGGDTYKGAFTVKISP